MRSQLRIPHEVILREKCSLISSSIYKAPTIVTACFPCPAYLLVLLTTFLKPICNHRRAGQNTTSLFQIFYVRTRTAGVRTVLSPPTLPGSATRRLSSRGHTQTQTFASCFRVTHRHGQQVDPSRNPRHLVTTFFGLHWLPVQSVVLTANCQK